MIFHVITNFEALGGAERSLLKVINGRDADVAVLVALKSVSSQMRAHIKNPKVEIVGLEVHSISSAINAIFTFRGLLRRYKPKVVFAWMYHAIFFSSLTAVIFGCPYRLIWNVRHSLDNLGGEKLFTRLMLLFGRWLKSTATMVHYCSYNSMRQHTELGYSDLGNSVYTPNGYEKTTYVFRDYGEEIVLGFAGRFHSDKGIRDFLEVCQILTSREWNIRVRMCGRGISKSNNALMDSVLSCGLDPERLELLGEQDDMLGFYNSIDLFVLSSITEGFPNTLVEAILASRPAFTTNVGDAKIIIDDEQFISPARAPELLADNIENFVNKPRTDREKACKVVHERISQRFSMENFLNSYGVD